MRGATRMDNRRMVTLSKFLSKYLRHEPETLGLTLEVGGWERLRK